MRFIILLMLLCSQAYAGEQWYQCKGIVKTSIGNLGYEHPACGSKTTIKRRFLPWLAKTLVALEKRVEEKLELVDIICEPTHVACVDE